MRFSQRFIASLLLSAAAFAAEPANRTNLWAPLEPTSRQSITRQQQDPDKFRDWNDDDNIATNQWQSPNDNACYTMRTYRVRRVDRSDVTRGAGYTTCLPARSVQMKSATGRKK